MISLTHFGMGHGRFNATWVLYAMNYIRLAAPYQPLHSQVSHIADTTAKQRAGELHALGSVVPSGLFAEHPNSEMQVNCICLVPSALSAGRRNSSCLPSHWRYVARRHRAIQRVPPLVVVLNQSVSSLDPDNNIPRASVAENSIAHHSPSSEHLRLIWRRHQGSRQDSTLESTLTLRHNHTGQRYLGYSIRLSSSSRAMPSKQTHPSAHRTPHWLVAAVHSHHDSQADRSCSPLPIITSPSLGLADVVVDIWCPMNCIHQGLLDMADSALTANYQPTDPRPVSPRLTTTKISPRGAGMTWCSLVVCPLLDVRRGLIGASSCVTGLPSGDSGSPLTLPRNVGPNHHTLGFVSGPQALENEPARSPYRAAPNFK